MSILPETVTEKVHSGWHRLQPLITQNEIDSRIEEMAQAAKTRLNGKNVVLVRVRNGADKFADAFEEAATSLGMEYETGKITVKSMEGTETSGRPDSTEYSGANLEGKVAVLIEDIVDTGKTIDYLLQILAPYSPSIIEAIILFTKSERREANVDHVIKDRGFKVFGFVVGFNTDWDDFYRELPGLWLVKFKPENLKQLWNYVFPKMPVRQKSPVTV